MCAQAEEQQEEKTKEEDVKSNPRGWGMAFVTGAKGESGAVSSLVIASRKSYKRSVKAGNELSQVREGALHAHRSLF